MYEERRETFSIRDIILQVLLVILFVLLLVWIFPTKSYVRKLFNSSTPKNEETIQVSSSASELEKLAVLYNQIFANNVAIMKEAAIGYYTNERLPQEIGDSDKMTLQQMYDKHLVLKLTDKKGNACSPTKSYVEITKYKDEYRMKVNLSCTDEEDYIIVYLGCYDYCDGDVCEKTTPTKPNPKPPVKKYYCKVVSGKYYDAKGKVVSKSEYEKSCNTKKKEYICEYEKVTGGHWGDYGNWSAWTTTKLSASSNTQVETKVDKKVDGYKEEKQQVGTKTETYIKSYNYEKYISGYKTEKYIKEYKDEKYLTGYKDEQYISGYNTEKYITGYVTQKVKVGTKKVQTGTTTKTVTKKVAAGTTNQYVSSSSGTTIPSNGNGYIYVKTGSKTSQSCSGCATKTVYTWDVYRVVTVYKTVTETETIPVYTVQDVYETKQVPVYGTKKTPIYATKQVPVYATKKVPVYATKKTPIYATKKVPVYGTKEVPVYKTVKVPIYKNVTYYRSRTRSYVGGSRDTKWSTCEPKDQTLINKGYSLTGNKKVKN